MSLWSVNQRYQNIVRYREIGEILLKHGFHYIIDKLDLWNLIPLRKRLFNKGNKVKLPLEARIRMALEELGPTFIKLGQILSIRPDLIPQDVILELEKLQDEVASIPFDFIKKNIEKELGRSLNEAFKYFSEEPIATASIGQVHLGELHDGRKVVVKVQRPGVANSIKRDLKILMNFASVLEQRVPASSLYDPVGIVEEFTRVLNKELDYGLEGRNTERFRRNFADDKTVYIPKIYWDLTTTHILTMEMVQGVKVSNIEELKKKGHDLHKIAYNGARALLKQILVDGFFHADPHPGNILIRDDGSIAFIDFGMVGRLDEELLRELASLFRGIIQRDPDRILSVLDNIGIMPAGVELHGLKYEIIDIVDEYYYKPISQIDIGRLMNQLATVATSYNIKLPLDFILLGKSILTIEGVGRKLDPEFNISKILEPFMKEFLRSKEYKERVIRATVGDTLGYVEKVLKVPGKIDRLLDKAEKGEIEVNMKIDELKTLISRMDVLANRIILGMITTGLIIGSSLIMQTERAPMIWGFPLIGVGGYFLAGFFGIFIVIWLLRSGRF